MCKCGTMLWKGTSPMAYEDEPRRIANRLRAPGYYWSARARIEALMGWLHHRGHCVYCGVQLVDASHMIGGLAGTDRW